MVIGTYDIRNTKSSKVNLYSLQCKNNVKGKVTY